MNETGKHCDHINIRSNDHQANLIYDFGNLNVQVFLEDVPRLYVWSLSCYKF